MGTIDLKTVTVELREDGIMHVHIKEAADMGISDAMQVVKAMGKLGNQKKFPVLVDCDEFATVDKEAKEFWAKKKPIYIQMLVLLPIILLLTKW